MKIQVISILKEDNLSKFILDYFYYFFNSFLECIKLDIFNLKHFLIFDTISQLYGQHIHFFLCKKKTLPKTRFVFINVTFVA